MFEDSSTDDYAEKAIADIEDKIMKILQTALEVTQP